MSNPEKRTRLDDTESQLNQKRQRRDKNLKRLSDHRDENVEKRKIQKTEDEIIEKTDEGKLFGANLKQFDHEKICPDSFLIIVGKRRFGKTTWLQWMLSFCYLFFTEAFVFTKTKHNLFWSNHVPESRIYDGYNDEVAQSIMDEQKAIKEMIRDKTVPKNFVPFKLIILDDVIADDLIRNSNTLEELVFSGRHYFLFVAIATQDIKGIGPKIRQNADLVVLTYQTQERSIKAIKEDFADIFESKNDFKEVIKENTQDHQVIVIDQIEAHFNSAEVFFKDKAMPKKVKPFKIGTKEFWEQSGCNWYEQRRLFKFREKMFIEPDRDHWLTLGKRRENREKREKAGERMGDTEETTDFRLVSNNPSATPEDDEMEEPEPPKSYIRQAMERDPSVYLRFKNGNKIQGN